MPVYVRLARSLYVLRDVTVSELAAHAGVGRVAAKAYLHQRKGTLVEPIGSAPATGRGRRPTRWRLTEDGASRLRADLKQLLVEDSSFVDERASAATKLRGQVEHLLAELTSLGDEAVTVPEQEWNSREAWLRQRIRAAMTALGDLGGLAVLPTETAALAHAGALLDQLRSQRLEHEEESGGVRRALDAYVNAWVEMIRTDLAPIVRLQTILPAGITGAAPIIFLDGLRKSDDLREQIRQAGSAADSPVFRIPLARLSRDDAAAVAGRLAEHMRFAAGSATQLVAAIDSGDLANAGKTADALFLVQQSRGERGMHAADFEHPRLAERAEQLLYEVGVAFGRLAVTSAAAGGQPVVPNGVLLIAGALNRARSGSHFGHLDESQPPHIPPFCIDAENDDRLAEDCRDLNVRYVPGGGASGFSLPALHPLPLVTTPTQTERAEVPTVLAMA